jgi:hypothetical protein
LQFAEFSLHFSWVIKSFMGLMGCEGIGKVGNGWEFDEDGIK